RRYTMDLFRVIRNIKTIWLNQIVLMCYQISHFIMQLPGYLNTAGPVIGIGNGRVPTLGQTRCLGIKNYIHQIPLLVTKLIASPRKYTNKDMEDVCDDKTRCV